MAFIDGKKCLNANSIKAFIENENTNNIVQMFIEDTAFLLERPLKDLRSFFEDENVENAITNDDVVISFILNDKILQILGIDYRWWIAPYRRKKYGRLNQLFDTNVVKQEKSKQSNRQMICCATAIIENNVVSDIKEYEDEPKNLIPILNKEYTKNVLQTRFKPTLKFCFNYKAGDNGLDIYDAANYKSFEELVNEGVFVL